MVGVAKRAEAKEEGRVKVAVEGVKEVVGGVDKFV